MLLIRPAVVTDAQDICEVVRRSIVELCVLDHRNDPALLAAWLANKQPETVARWIADAGNRCLVAEVDDRLRAAGCVTRSGEVTLNYVDPSVRFRGVSSALLEGLERAALGDGNTVVSLGSTATARRFYVARGYREHGVPGNKHGLLVFRMRKSLLRGATAHDHA